MTLERRRTISVPQAGAHNPRQQNLPNQCGWNVFCTSNTGYDALKPALHSQLRGQGTKGWFGWPSSPELEALRKRWLDTSDFPGQRQLAAEIQAQAFEHVPYYPLGLHYRTTAYRADLTGMLNDIPAFWSVRRAWPGEALT